MPVRIYNPQIKGNRQFVNGSTPHVTIEFTGIALDDDVDVIVEFTIAPFPEMSFNSFKVVTAPFVFGKTEKIFSKEVTILNQNPTHPTWQNGLVALTIQSYINAPQYAGFIYK